MIDGREFSQGALRKAVDNCPLFWLTLFKEGIPRVALGVWKILVNLYPLNNPFYSAREEKEFVGCSICDCSNSRH